MNWPKSTFYNRFLPKETLYRNKKFTEAEKTLLVDNIEKIIWSYKISPDTLNLQPSSLLELQVFTITTKDLYFDDKALVLIDQAIPFPIIFLVENNSKQKAFSVYYKDFSKKTKPLDTFSTPWQSSLNFSLDGRSVEEIFQNLIYQIDPTLRDNPNTKEQPLKIKIITRLEKNRLINLIEKANRQIYREKNAGKQQEMVKQRILLENELKKL